MANDLTNGGWRARRPTLVEHVKGLTSCKHWEVLAGSCVWLAKFVSGLPYSCAHFGYTRRPLPPHKRLSHFASTEHPYRTDCPSDAQEEGLLAKGWIVGRYGRMIGTEK